MLVLGEMDVPAAIVERHLNPVPSPRPSPPAQDEDAEGAAEEVEEALYDYVEEELEAVELVEAQVEEELEVEEVGGGEPITAEVPVVDAAAEPVSEEDRDHPSVDDLFARLRASSSETVAREVLEAEVPPEVESPEVQASLTADAAGGSPSPAEPNPAGAAAIAQRQAALAPVRTALARQLKRVLADEQNDVLDRLRQRNASLVVDDVLGPAKRMPAPTVRWRRINCGPQRRRVRTRCPTSRARSSTPPSKPARCWIAASTRSRRSWWSRYGRGWPRASRCRVTPRRRPRLLRATYREWKGRIDDLGGDLVRTAYGRAAYAVLAPGTPVCWVFDPSGPACPDAEDNVLAGSVPAGEPFPTGHRYAPAYRGCRCLLVTDPG